MNVSDNKMPSAALAEGILVLGFGNPAIVASSALDPWLCVAAFRRVCPFVLNRYIVKERMP